MWSRDDARIDYVQPVGFSDQCRESVMYPWPIGDFDNAMDVALDTAMNYLDHTGQATKFPEVRRVAAMAIVAAWKTGEKNPVKLANLAIRAVERPRLVAKY